MTTSPLVRVALGQLCVLALLWVFVQNAASVGSVALLTMPIALAVALAAVLFLLGKGDGRLAALITLAALWLAGPVIGRLHGLVNAVNLSAEAMMFDLTWLILAPSLILFLVLARKHLPGSPGTAAWRQILFGAAGSAAVLLLYKLMINGDSIP